MAEIVAGFVGPAIEVVKWVGVPIIRQFNYLCCFTTNITTLKQEAQKLDDAAAGLQGQIDRARDNVQVIVPQVETWLTTSKDIKNEMDEILNKVSNAEIGCLKLRDRFFLSKRAKKTTDLMIEHRGQCKFDAISQPGPPPATRAVPIGMVYEFESRKQIEEDIMTALRGRDVNMIGICGMGGLGKTTIAKRIMNRALEEPVFDEVVMTVVSQQVDTLKIQLEIGGSLGLDLKHETSQANRAQKLHSRLSGMKRILLVLDDVWKSLELEDLGIPSDGKGCTVLLTSRNSDELSSMNIENVFRMQVLSEEDSWFLFRERAGTCVDDAKLNSLAKQVVKECMGLPIALTTVGAALKGEKSGSIWKDALRQLRHWDPDIPNFIAKVYNPLRLSYNALDSKHAKFVFLLCCLFREDSDIELYYLTYFCMGLGIFDGGITNLEEARNRMCTLTKMLKSRSLLLDSEYGNDLVRMHDIVRDVCIFIAKQEGYIGDKNCNWISSYHIPTSCRLGFLNLHLLFLSGIANSAEKEIKLDSAFLEVIRGLHVLFIEHHSLTSLPQSLKNLKTLVLHFCQELETISVVGECVNLEILICSHCYRIKMLPPEIKGLSRLKLLDLTGCISLQRIDRGIISSLVGLEELKMLLSFSKWEASDRKERENAKLRELEALTNLRCLEIEIDDLALAAENIHLSSKLDRFDIEIHDLKPSWSLPQFSSNKVSLLWDGETHLGEWIKMLLRRDVECLNLNGNGANINLELAKSEKIRWLRLGECENMKRIVTTSMDDDHPLFPSVECLELFALPELEEIWDAPISSTSFQNLKNLSLTRLPALKQFWKSSTNIPLLTNLSRIDIYGCPRLRNLEQLSIAGHDCLSQLRILHIDRCEMMELVFLWNEQEDENITKMFPKLEDVGLSCLPNLATFYQGIGGVEFPLLNTLCIRECPKFTSFVSTTNQNNSEDDDQCHYDDSSRLIFQLSKLSFKELETNLNPFFGHKFNVSSFNELEKLRVYKYQGIMCLFTSSIAGNLVNLRELIIRECYEMVKVIEDDDNCEEEKIVSGGEIRRTLVFPNLQELKLKNLDKLVSFCKWKCDIELPSLKIVKIKECPNMKFFTLGPLTTPKLEEIELRSLPNLTTFSQGIGDVDQCYHHDNSPLFCQLSKASFKKLETDLNPFCAHKFHVSSFNELEMLTVYKYQGSMCLFTSSIAGNLVNLRELIILECYEMVKVIEDEGNDEKEKAVSSGGEIRRTLVFPKLQELRLRNLGKLGSFCEWKCEVELPSLKEVEIKKCPSMNFFTLGPITTPNLKSVEINNEDFGGAKDLNVVLQQHLAQPKEGGKENQEEMVE
ncbi:NB-ARC domain-containing disease resistance protein [Perilla frutescens var. frutescens]|nr:NB-ARC domain-containing disease resistance protein [Perilla frutescens var. frutescens]